MGPIAFDPRGVAQCTGHGYMTPISTNKVLLASRLGCGAFWFDTGSLHGRLRFAPADVATSGFYLSTLRVDRRPSLRNQDRGQIHAWITGVPKNHDSPLFACE